MSREYRTDRELVLTYQNTVKGGRENVAAAHELWDKYAALRTEMKNYLRTLCERNGFKMGDMLEEWDCRAYEKFINQMDGNRMERVEHIKDWKIHIRLYGYWKSMNRDMVREWLEKNGVRGLPFEMDNSEKHSIFSTDSGGGADGLSVEGYLYERIGWEPVENISAAETNKVIFREALEVVVWTCCGQ